MLLTIKSFHPGLCGMFFTVFLSVFTGFKTTQAQIIWAGAKLGGHVNWMKIDDPGYGDTVSMHLMPGINVGGVLSFKVLNRYFLHTEYLYTTKSKVVKGKIDPDLKDRVTYHYAELPILFTMQFKGQFGKHKDFKWHLGAGPNFAYLLGGKGVIESGELKENGISSLSYKIAFGERGEDRNHNDRIHYTGVNRLQFGLNLGAGLLFEPSSTQKFIIDLRYTFDQTLFGKKEADYIIPHDYDDNLRVRNRSVRVSVMYLFQYNLNKKIRNRGKSTLK